MAEVIIALGVISSVISCIEMSIKVSDRLDYYLSRTKSPPHSEQPVDCGLPPQLMRSSIPNPP